MNLRALVFLMNFSLCQLLKISMWALQGCIKVLHMSTQVLVSSVHHIDECAYRLEASTRTIIAAEARDRCQHRYVVGLLGARMQNYHYDHWIATDFVVLRTLMDALPDRSSWFCQSSFRDHPPWEILLGHPNADRIVFEPPPFEEIVPDPVALRTRFFHSVINAATVLSRHDELVLVLTGHGTREDGWIWLGVCEDGDNVFLKKEEVELLLDGALCQVILFVTSCYSGHWTSPRWTLHAACQANQVAKSLRKSRSQMFRGGIFVSSLLFAHTAAFSIQAPQPGLVGINGKHDAQSAHNFGPDSHTLPRPIQQTLPTFQALMDHFKARVQSPGTQQNFLIDNVIWDEHSHHNLPLRHLTNDPGSLQRSKCLPPSAITSD
ncbi:hypothetical protein BKA93DRAFT_824250 [Sparassis latifolia]